MRNVLLVSMFLLAAVPAAAQTGLIPIAIGPSNSGSDKLFTADGGIRFNAGDLGITTCEGLANGDAQVTFFVFDFTADPDTLLGVWSGMDDAAGDGVLYLWDGVPRMWTMAGAGVDSAYVDVDTADKVILSW